MLVVFNYTGDRINFGLAAERARAEGIRVSIRFVADDCALESDNKAVGRRGLLGGIAAIKTLGAASEAGKKLEFMEKLFDLVTEPSTLGTIGFAASGCSLPTGESGINLNPGEVELGLGVHGEPGIRKYNVSSMRALVAELLKPVQRRLKLATSDDLLLLVNNLGGLTEIEQLNLITSILEELAALNLKVSLVGSGHIMTSLDMAGANFSLLKMSAEIREFITAPCSFPAWPTLTTPAGEIIQTSETKETSNDDCKKTVSWDVDGTRAIVSKVCNSLIASKDLLNELDAAAGDGDCGSTVVLGAEAVLEAVNGLDCDPSAFFYRIASALENDMGGSSGSLLSLLFTAFATTIKISEEKFTAKVIISAFSSGCKQIMEIGRAAEQDRTMLDALCPALRELQSSGDLSKAAKAARAGADATKNMIARAGRASYCKDRDSAKVPDAGSVMVAIAFEALV